MVVRAFGFWLAAFIGALPGPGFVVISSARVAEQSAATAAGGTSSAGATDPDDTSVRIDAVVTDRQGRPILDLRPSDFELIENGAPKSIGAVELRVSPREPSADSGPIENERDEERAARRPGTRVFAFFLDEFHLTAGVGADRARDALTRFVDEQLRPQDLALVMKPLDPVTSLRFTRDRAALRGAIAGLAGRKGDLAPRTPFEEEYVGRAAAAVKAARAQIVTAGLRELTLRMGALRADRAVVLLVSEGFPRDNPADRQTRPPDLQGVVRASSRFHLSTYTFNPTPPAEDASPATERERDTATLQWLAAQTGGRSFVEPEALRAGLGRMAGDLATYYALTFHTPHADGRFHTIEVRAKRRDAEVHARPGYWAPLGSEWKALVAAATALPPISRRALRRSTIIESWIGLVSDSAGRARMAVSWEPRSTSAAAAPQFVVVKARTTAGAPLFEGQVASVQTGSAGSADRARFDVPAGRVELDLSILDTQGKVLETESRDFDVPDLRSQKRGPVLLLPEVVRARTLRDFRKVSSDPDAAPSSVRTFARGDRLLIRVPAFDSSGTAVRVTAKVLNGLGQPMRDIETDPGTPGSSVTQFALPLAWLVPGEYLIELSGTNVNGTARERVSFKIKG